VSPRALLFLSGLLEGILFPKFAIPGGEGLQTAAPSGLNTANIKGFFMNTYPASGPDLAKLIFWCFLAGFSERFVPQIITNIGAKATSNKEEEEK